MRPAREDNAISARIPAARSFAVGARFAVGRVCYAKLLVSFATSRGKRDFFVFSGLLPVPFCAIYEM